MMYSNVIVYITISRGSFVFSQSRVKVSASLTYVGSLAVRAFDLVNCSLSVVGFLSFFNVSPLLVCGLHGCCRDVRSVRWSQKCP